MTAGPGDQTARGLVARLTPRLRPGSFVFASLSDPALATRASARAIATMREDEGLSVILPLAEAAALGIDRGNRMRLITLGVHSALDAVGLTAAVSAALAAEGIPCNVVAGFHHDHIFIPEGTSDAAMTVLRALQKGAA